MRRPTILAAKGSKQSLDAATFDSGSKHCQTAIKQQNGSTEYLASVQTSKRSEYGVSVPISAFLLFGGTMTMTIDHLHTSEIRLTGPC